MPTTITIHKYGSRARDELATCAQALLLFYGVIAVVVSLLLVLEERCGMFEGLSAAQTLLKATGVAQIADE